MTNSTWACLFVLWFFCGLIAGYIYGQRGRSAQVGFLAGLLLGPLGVLLTVLTAPDQEVLADRARELEPKPWLGAR